MRGKYRLKRVYLNTKNMSNDIFVQKKRDESFLI